LKWRSGGLQSATKTTNPSFFLLGARSSQSKLFLLLTGYPVLVDKVSAKPQSGFILNLVNKDWPAVETDHPHDSPCAVSIESPSTMFAHSNPGSSSYNAEHTHTSIFLVMS
jgi:hypothetical protein